MRSEKKKRIRDKICRFTFDGIVGKREREREKETVGRERRYRKRERRRG